MFKLISEEYLIHGPDSRKQIICGPEGRRATEGWLVLDHI